MDRLTVVAKVVAKNECIGVVKSELLKLIAPTRQENGCIDYILHQDVTDPSIFIFFENWKDSSSLEMHKTSDHYKAYIIAVDGMIEDKSVHKMAVVA